MKVRITAIGVAVLMLLLPLSLCCMPAPQHACCKDRCAMAPDAAPLVAIPFVAILLPSSTPAASDCDDLRRSDGVGAGIHPRFNPMATIQLRI
jgi:hypothetical protein